MPLKYRSDIDGLRAIAVLSVIFFHTGVPGFSGGFVGVDIFFVISGYLITSIILNEIKVEKLSIARFYERRIRRIFPALFPVIAFTLAVGAYLFDPVAFKGLGQSITATTLFSSNILFWHQAGYFDAPSLQKPLLHTWSLAVEEQFYIFFPLTIVLIHRYLKSKYLLWILIAITLSLGASIYGVYQYPSETFYLVPTRAWELLSGSLLALGTLPTPSSSWLKNLLSVTGAGLIVYSVGFYTEATVFPGQNAIAPVLGTCLIIYSNKAGENMAIVNAALSVRPLVFIGLISYSLYLWHWPLVAFSKYLMFRPFNGYERAAIILASLVVSTLSWKYIEHPFRSKQMLLPERKGLFAMAGVVMIVTSGIGGVIHLQGGMPKRFDMFSPELAATISKVQQDSIWDSHVKWEKITEKIGEGSIPQIVGAKNITPSFALVGDSHARALIPAFERQGDAEKLSGFILTKSATPFLLGIRKVSNYNSFDDVSYNNAVLAFIKAHPEIKTVFLTSRWGAHMHGSWAEKYNVPLITQLYDTQYDVDQSNKLILCIGLRRAVNTLLTMNRRVVLVSDVPGISNDVPRVYAISARWPMLVNMDEIRPTISEYNKLQHEVQVIFAELAKLSGVTLIHPESRMFDENGRGRIMANGELLYRDSDHLSTAGALFVAPVFDEVFKEMATSQKSRDMRMTSLK